MVRSDRARNRCARLCLIMVAAGTAASAHAVEYTEGPAVAIVPFKGSGPEAQMGKGLADMVVTDVVQLAPPACKLVVVEWEKRALVEAEIKLQQRPEFDPATRAKPGKLIDPRYFLEGSVGASSSEVGWSLQLRDSKTNRIVARESGQTKRDALSNDDLLKISERIARRVIASLCSTGADYSGRRTASPAPPPPPPAPASVQGPPPVPQAPPPPSPSQDVQDAVNTMNKLRGLFGR
jgi:TolB-like protein